jgi:hypothetical protein
MSSASSFQIDIAPSSSSPFVSVIDGESYATGTGTGSPNSAFNRAEPRKGDMPAAETIDAAEPCRAFCARPVERGVTLPFLSASCGGVPLGVFGAVPDLDGVPFGVVLCLDARGLASSVALALALRAESEADMACAPCRWGVDMVRVRDVCGEGLADRGVDGNCDRAADCVEDAADAVLADDDADIRFAPSRTGGCAGGEGDAGPSRACLRVARPPTGADWRRADALSAGIALARRRAALAGSGTGVAFGERAVAAAAARAIECCVLTIVLPSSELLAVEKERDLVVVGAAPGAKSVSAVERRERRVDASEGARMRVLIGSGAVLAAGGLVGSLGMLVNGWATRLRGGGNVQRGRCCRPRSGIGDKASPPRGARRVWAR